MPARRATAFDWKSVAKQNIFHYLKGASQPTGGAFNDTRKLHWNDVDPESIQAASETNHIPVTFDSCGLIVGPFFHGTKASLGVGELVVPGE